MPSTTVSIFDYRTKDEGEIIKSYSFKSREKAESFMWDFNMTPQAGSVESHRDEIPKSLKPLRAVIVGDTEKWDGTKIYLMHTVRVAHEKKRVLMDEITIMTRKEIEKVRAEFPDSPVVKAFDGMMVNAKIWDNPRKAYKAMLKGVKTGTPLEEPDVIELDSMSNDLVTYVSFLPNIRMRISAVWDKTMLIDKDMGKDEQRWIDTSHMFLCMDCNEDTDDLNEYYIVSDEIWQQAVPENKGKLCIECLEKRIGRKLNSKDFPLDIPLNWSFTEGGSGRLKDRMTESGAVHWDTQKCERITLATGQVERAFSDWQR